MIKAVAVDDEPLVLELLEMYCSHFNFLQFEKGFYSTAAALQYLDKNPVDLLFLDICMPAMSGFEFYDRLAQKPMLVFTTSHSGYALESYELNALDYLLKPFTLARFEKAVTKAKDLYYLRRHAAAVPAANWLLLKADYGLIKIALADILFIEGLDNYLKIHLQSSPHVVVRMTLKALMEELSEAEFIRVHRSYIVPLQRVEAIKQKSICVAGKEIPVGKAYEEFVKAVFNKKG